MLRHILLACLFAFSISNFAQNFRFTDPSFLLSAMEGFEWRYNNLDQDVLKENRVKSCEIIRYFKGSPSASTRYFDKEGRVIREERKAKKGLAIMDCTYDDRGNLTERSGTNSIGQKYKTNYTYDSENKMTAWERVNYKGEYSAGEMEYDVNGKLLWHKLYEKNREIPFRELAYSYYENGDRKTTSYFEKGKLKHSWNYDCKPEGELIGVKTKDETTICKMEEIDSSGNRVTWERKFNEKGQLTKVKTVCSPDSLVLSKQIYSGTDKLVSETIYAYNDEGKNMGVKVFAFDKHGKAYLNSETTVDEFGTRETTAYNRKGEITYTDMRVKNGSGKTIKSQHSQGRGFYTSLYNYNEESMIQSEVRMQRKRTYVTEYNYTFY